LCIEIATFNAVDKSLGKWKWNKVWSQNFQLKYCKGDGRIIQTFGEFVVKGQINWNHVYTSHTMSHISITHKYCKPLALHLLVGQ